MLQGQPETGRHATRTLWTTVLVLVAMTACTPTPPAFEEDSAMTSSSRHFFASSLGSVHYVDVGRSEGPPVVLLHQTPRSIDEFRDVIPVVAAEHRVVAVDNPGYGCSDVPDHQPTVEEYADSVVALLDHLGVSRAHLVGHHTGAVLAIDIAARYPDRVAKLVLSGPPYLNQASRDSLREISVQWRIRPDGSHMQEKWDKFMGWTDDPTVVHRVVTDLLSAGETSEYGHLSCADYRMEDTLPLVKGPALILVGDNDFFATNPRNAVFGETIPNAETRMLDGGVFLPSESPDAFAAAVLDYLRAEG
jgi:pimeloyl-ACP methyl ester carboxylesterase